MAKMNPVVHFEMPAEDRKRMINFYSSVFGWQANQLGADMADYTVMTTTEIDEKTKFPKTPGKINGGFYKKGDTKQNTTPRIVIAVDDISEHIQKVRTAGGEIVEGPDDISGIGQYALFRDSEGNIVGMIQPSPLM